MAKQPSADTTAPGYTNRNDQVNLGYDSPNGTDHLQKVYALRCKRKRKGKPCGHKYGANGSDIHERKCPLCQGGEPGLPLTQNWP